MVCDQTYLLSNDSPQRTLTYIDEVFRLTIQISPNMLITKTSTQKSNVDHTNFQPTWISTHTN